MDNYDMDDFYSPPLTPAEQDAANFLRDHIMPALAHDKLPERDPHYSSGQGARLTEKGEQDTPTATITMVDGSQYLIHVSKVKR